MKMTAFAFGSKCGGRGASGLTNVPGAAAAARLKNPSAESRPVRATAPNPRPVSHRNSRRVRRQNWRSVIGRTPEWTADAADGTDFHGSDKDIIGFCLIRGNPRDPCHPWSIASSSIQVHEL